VIIECRDHKQRQDIKWIEQIATKKDDINANKAIAVSSSGFTKAAKDKARAKNIELRTLTEIDPKEIMEWFQAKKLTAYCLNYALIEVFFVLNGSIEDSQTEGFQKFIKSFSGTSLNYVKILVDPEIDDVLSLDDCISRRSDRIIEDFKPTNEKKIVEFNIIPQNEEAGFFIKTQDESIRLKQIKFKVEIWHEFTEAKIDSILSYDNEKNSLVQVVSVEDFVIGGVKRSFKIHRTPKNDMQHIEVFFKDLE
jgi:Restriction endonuclease